MKWRTVWVAALAGLLMVSGTGAAFATQTDTAGTADTGTADGPVLEEVKERVLGKIADRIERLEAIVEALEGEDGIVAEQKVALAREGIAIFEAAAAEVEAAGTVREVVEAYRGAVREFKAHQKVRHLYAHVHLDLAKFERRLDRLEQAIDRAGEAGYEVSAAAAEAGSAAADLAAAADQVAAVDPSQIGGEVMDDLKEAHRTAHAGQRHIRAGWEALFEVLPPE